MASDQNEHLYNGFDDTTIPRTQEQINATTAEEAAAVLHTEGLQAFGFQVRVQDASAPPTSFQQLTFQQPVHGRPQPHPNKYRRPCVFWERGYCRNGRVCTYLHRDFPRQQAEREQAERFRGFQRYVREHDERSEQYQRQQQGLQTQQGMYTPQGERTGPLLVPREQQQQNQQSSSMQHQHQHSARDRYANTFIPMTASEVEQQKHYVFTPAGVHGGVFTRVDPTLEQQYRYQQLIEQRQPPQAIPRTTFSEDFMTTGAAAHQEQTWSQRVERDGTTYVYMTPAVEHQLYMAGHLTPTIQQQQMMARVDVGGYEQQYAPPQQQAPAPYGSLAASFPRSQQSPQY